MVSPLPQILDLSAAQPAFTVLETSLCGHRSYWVEAMLTYSGYQLLGQLGLAGSLQPTSVAVGG